MSENRDNEARCWNEDEAHAEKAVADLRRSMDRLRSHLGAYRDQISDDDNAGEIEADETTGKGSEA